MGGKQEDFKEEGALTWALKWSAMKTEENEGLMMVFHCF